MAHAKHPRLLFVAGLLLAVTTLSGVDAQTITGNFVFLDRDGDGIFVSTGEDVLFTNPLTVEVVRIRDGVVVGSATARGSYSIPVSGNIVGESFEVRVSIPTGTNVSFVAPNQGVNAGDIDSNVNAAGVSDPISFAVTPAPVVNVGVQENVDLDLEDDDMNDGDGGDGGDAGDADGNAGFFLTPNVPGGVEIDAAGVLRLRRIDRTQGLSRKRARQMRAQLDPSLVRPSNLRKVSLNRLELAVANAIQERGVMSDAMAYLAGLTSIQNVFLMPETGDVIIAGPAEGFEPDAMGRMVGIKTQEATMQLQDLIVALRCFRPAEAPTPFIGCSIDPTPEGLQRMQDYIRQVAPQMTPADDVRFAQGLQQSLGSQVVTVEGVPASTHFAQVLVEADYRMKLIGIGLEDPPVAITSYIKRASPSSVSRNALQRWYFQPNYDCVRVSEDGLAMELEGAGVKLVGANERVQRDGQRTSVGHVDKASAKFVRSFTQRYAALARKEAVFGQLGNLIECSIVAAFLQQEDVYGQCSWDAAVFGDEQLIPTEIYRTPKTVDAAVNVVWKGGTLMTPIGGGVSIEAARAIGHSTDEDGSLEAARQQVSMPELADGQWWWD